MTEMVRRSEWEDVVAENARLRGDLEHAYAVLVFADGVAVVNTGFALADLYSETHEPAQRALKAAGCHARGAIRAGEDPHDPFRMADLSQRSQTDMDKA